LYGKCSLVPRVGTSKTQARNRSMGSCRRHHSPIWNHSLIETVCHGLVSCGRDKTREWMKMKMKRNEGEFKEETEISVLLFRPKTTTQTAHCTYLHTYIHTVTRRLVGALDLLGAV
jgi:hypothetical protein